MGNLFSGDKTSSTAPPEAVIHHAGNDDEHGPIALYDVHAGYSPPCTKGQCGGIVDSPVMDDCGPDTSRTAFMANQRPPYEDEDMRFCNYRHTRNQSMVPCDLEQHEDRQLPCATCK